MKEDDVFSSTADFSQPIELLEACHERILRHCAALRTLAVHHLEFGSDKEAREAAKGILRYFADTALCHHLDEETDLFPALLAAAPESQKIAVEKLVAHLRSEHQSLEGIWRRVCIKLEEIVAGEPIVFSEALAHNLGEAYSQHIRLENDALFSYARDLLKHDDFTRLGASMAARHGVAARHT